jgi:hypothetical protein
MAENTPKFYKSVMRLQYSYDRDCRILLESYLNVLPTGYFADLITQAPVSPDREHGYHVHGPGFSFLIQQNFE